MWSEINNRHLSLLVLQKLQAQVFGFAPYFYAYLNRELTQFVNQRILALAMRRKRFDTAMVMALLLDAIDESGSQKKFAAKHFISESYLSDVIKGRRDIGERILSALNLRRVVYYERNGEAK